MGHYVKDDFRIPVAKCLRCDYLWNPRKSKIDSCPKCKSRYWNRERVRKISKPAKKCSEKSN